MAEAYGAHPAYDVTRAAGGVLQPDLWGVTPTDPVTFIAVVATLLGVAFVASVVPAMRVLRLDPAKTLRAE